MTDRTKPNLHENNLLHEENIENVSKNILAGNTFIIPTETVYGLAANALNDAAIAKIYEVKRRPTFNPLIVHVSSIEKAQEYVEITENAKILADKFWPGPLTMVLPKTKNCPISNLVSAGLDTIAIRSPQHPITQAILKKCGLPLAAPSANFSGTLSPTSPNHISKELLESVGGIIDGGTCEIGLESTIVGFKKDNIIILRPGSVSKEDLIEALSIPVSIYQGNDITSPGQMTRHYAPNAGLRLNAFGPQQNEFMIGFGAVDGDINLSISGNLTEAASNLFTMLREADRSGKENIAVAPIPFEAIGFAINDRLERATKEE